MKKILSLIVGVFFIITAGQAQELAIEKQLVGIVGATSGTVKTETRELKPGDKIYLNETIYASSGSGTQILLLDQSTFTIGSDSEVVMDTFIYDPATNDGKIVASVKQGSLKVISGLISKKDPDSLTVEVPEGTLGSRGTEFQTIVSKKRTDTLLIGPGKNNTLGLRPGAVLVGNKFGQTMLNNPYSVSTMRNGQAPGKAKQITKKQLKKFKKKMKALRVAKLDGTSKEERKALRKKIRQDLKAQGFEKEEIKALIKENLKKDKEERIVLLKERGEDVSDLEQPEGVVEDEIEVDVTETEVAEPEAPEAPEAPETTLNKIEQLDKDLEKQTKDKKAIKKKKNKKKKKGLKKKKKGKKKKAVKKKKGKKKKAKASKKKKGKKKKAVKKKSSKKKKKAVKKKSSKKKKKAVKKKKAKKKKVVKKKAKKKKKKVVKKKKKKKKVVKKKKPKKKKVVKKKPKKKKKVVKKRKIVKKKVAKKKQKRKNKRRRKK